MGPLLAWGLVRLHRLQAQEAIIICVGYFKKSLSSQPLGVRISRVGPRCVYSKLTTPTTIATTLQVILWAYVKVHTPLGKHWKIFIINFLSTCLIFSHYSPIWALVCDPLGLFDMPGYISCYGLSCVFHYLQFQCSLSPHCSWELYLFVFSQTRIRA